jgi:hypothetical protein
MPLILSGVLLFAVGVAMESQGVTDFIAYAIMGYACGFIGWVR